MLRCLLLSLSVLMCVLPLHAAQKPAETDPLGKEPKLDQRVRVVSEGVPVSDLLARISKSTGIILKADAAVADDKVIVFGPNGVMVKAKLTSLKVWKLVVPV